MFSAVVSRRTRKNPKQMTNKARLRARAASRTAEGCELPGLAIVSGFTIRKFKRREDP